MKETIHLQSLKVPLFLTRISIAYFMGVWALDRLTAADHASKVAEKFYDIGPIKISALPPTLVGIALLLLIAVFIAGYKKRISYGLILALHLIGTIKILPTFIPFTESFVLIFSASIPTLMAMLLLYCLRNEDTLLSLDD